MTCSMAALHLLYHFYELEEAGLLNPNLDLDIFDLHFVYFPLLNHKLEQFRSIWSHHPLRTEHNKTPHQLWFSGISGSSDTLSLQRVLEPMTEVLLTLGAHAQRFVIPSVHPSVYLSVTTFSATTRNGTTK